MLKNAFVALALIAMFAASGCVFHGHAMHCAAHTTRFHDEVVVSAR